MKSEKAIAFYVHAPAQNSRMSKKWDALVRLIDPKTWDRQSIKSHIVALAYGSAGKLEPFFNRDTLDKFLEFFDTTEVTIDEAYNRLCAKESKPDAEIKLPFTPEEGKVYALLLEAHELYTNLPETYPGFTDTWTTHMHALQHLLNHRVLQRDYPDLFASK